MRIALRPVQVAACLATAGAIALSLPPLRALIEQSMVWHMLVQMPLLGAAGWLAASAVEGRLRLPRLARFNRYGLSGFMLVQMMIAFWMIPAMIDRAVVLPSTDLLKLASLWLCGGVLRDAFRRAPIPVQLFFIGYALPMGVWLGVYLASTDLRLCNAYTLASQLNAGRGLVAMSLLVGGVWLSFAVRAPRHRGAERPLAAPRR